MTKQKVYALCAETGLNPLTIHRFFAGVPTSKRTHEAIEAACRRLGIPLPAKASDQPENKNDPTL